MEGFNLLRLSPSLNVTHAGQVGVSDVQTDPALPCRVPPGSQGELAGAVLSRGQELNLQIPTFPSKTESDRQLISVDVPI